MTAQMEKTEDYLKMLEATIIAVMGQTVQTAMSQELTRFQMSVQGARAGPPRQQVDQDVYGYDQVHGQGRVPISFNNDSVDLAAKVAQARASLRR